MLPCISHVLNIHSDVEYLSEREAKSMAGEFFYMGSNTDKTKRLTNGAILNLLGITWLCVTHYNDVHLT
jgi:hypothetical protein